MDKTIEQTDVLQIFRVTYHGHLQLDFDYATESSSTNNNNSKKICSKSAKLSNFSRSSFSPLSQR